MGAPRFEPRTFCSTPELFGRFSELEWPLVGDSRVASQRDSAKFQHEFSLAVRLALKEKDTTLSKYAKDLDVDYGRLGRIMRGEIVMKLEDVMLASRQLRFGLRLTKLENEHQPMS